MLITFSGLDGCGKTTQIELFMRYLRERNYKFKRLAMYDDVSFSGFIRKILGKNRKDLNKEIKGYRQDKNRKDKSLVFFRKLVYHIDLSNYTIRTRRYKENSKNILIMDRCFYDTLANLFNTRSERYIEKMLRKTPKSDLAVFLDAEPNAAFKRKPEYNPEFYKERRDAYLHIFDSVKGDIIDSNREIDDVQNEIRRLFEEKKR